MKDMRTIFLSDDVLHFFAWKAACNYGDSRMFCSANFSGILQEEIGLTGSIDGLIVRMILTGRTWLEELPGATWKLKEQE